MTTGKRILLVDDDEALLRTLSEQLQLHGEFTTTASMVSQLGRDGRDRHWMTGASHPCRSPFQRMHFPESSPVLASAAAGE